MPNKITDNMENILKNNIIPDLEKLYAKEYNTDIDVLSALEKLENQWRTLPLPQEYDDALNMLANSKYKKEDIYKHMPYIYTYIFTMKLITYLFFNNNKFDSEISLISSLNQICIDKADNKEIVKIIIEQINYVQDIAMAKDAKTEKMFLSALQKNVENFQSYLGM